MVAYGTLCRPSELVSLRVKEININIRDGSETSSILLRKSKTNQHSTEKWLYLSQKAQIALMQWIEEIPQGQEYLIIGIDRG